MPDYRLEAGVAALETIGASRWTLLKARLFGKRTNYFDGANQIILSTYKGTTYFLKVRLAEDIQCPVCGYYCLGKGGHGCIDKPSLCSATQQEEI